MTKTFQPSDFTAEKKSHQHSDAVPSGTPITTSSDNVTQQRLKQRDAIKSFRLTRDSANSFTIDNGDGTHVKDKRPHPKESTDKSVEIVGAEKTAEQAAQLQKATIELLENAKQQFGGAKVQELQIAKDDVGSALAAVALGPNICKAIGQKETHALGNRLLVFGIAPMFGMADEAKKQFTQHPIETAHAGAGNYLGGAAIGTLLEHVHPAILAATLVGGSTMFVKDQLSSPEHRARNKEISAIADRIDEASNADLVAFMGRTKNIIGPDLYKGTFDIVTGTPALPNRAVVNVAIRDEVVSLSKIDVKDGIKVLQGLSDDVWNTLRPLFEAPGLKPAFAGAAHNMPGAFALEDSVLRMQRDAGLKSSISLDKLRASLDGLSKKTVEENTELVSKANSELLALSRSPVNSMDQAKALAHSEEKFTEHMKTVRQEMENLKPQAEAIQAKANPTSDEEKLVERYYAAEDALYQVVNDRLENLYGLGKHARVSMDTSVSVHSGMGSQREVANAIGKLFDHGLEKDPLIRIVLESHGVSPERAKDWVGIPMTGSSGADHAGCDFLLTNKNTGEMYPLDVTERAMNMKTGGLFESRLTNHELLFTNKDVPNERKHLVIGVASEVARDDARYDLSRQLNISSDEAEKILKEREKKQLTEIIAHTIAQPSKLNLIETPLPSSIGNAPPSRQAYELWRFRTSLEKIGYFDWARAVTKSINYLRSQNKGLPFYE